MFSRGSEENALTFFALKAEGLKVYQYQHWSFEKVGQFYPAIFNQKPIESFDRRGVGLLKKHVFGAKIHKGIRGQCVFWAANQTIEAIETT